MSNISSKKTKKRLPLKWKIFFSFAGFTAALLLLLWICQIWLLDSFYYAITRRNLIKCGSTLSEETSDNLQVTADRLALEHELCILIFDDTGGRLAASETTGSCVIHKLGNANLNELYNRALEEGGVSVAPVMLDGNLDRKDGFSSTQSDEESTPGTQQKIKLDLSRLVYSSVLSTPEGGKRFILLDCPLSPVSAISDTLRIQLTVISLIGAVAALSAAVILARRLSRPIVGLSESADRLAGGEYDTEFRGGGCREIDDLSATLSFAAKELSKVDRMQRELIANISHDLRTPLTMISGYVEVMRDIPGENTPENMQVILDETNRLSSLVNDLVNVSRIQSGQKQYKPERFSLTEAVRTTVQRFTKLNECKGYRFRFSAAENTVVFADKGGILQVLYNLIGNAVNYSGNDKTVTVLQTTVNGSVRIDICDTGEGIPESELPNIWNRYYRGEQSNHRRGVGGSGIGLSVVKSVLDAHHAPYGVISQEGKGSDFWFSLPAVSIEETSEESDSSHLK